MADTHQMTTSQQPRYITGLSMTPELWDAWADVIRGIEAQTGRENPLTAYEAAYELAFRLLQHEIQINEYHHYLRTKTWERTRQRALKAARFRCHLCSAQMNLDVHHRTYDRIGHEADDDMVVLCRPCHATFHGIVRGGG